MHHELPSLLLTGVSSKASSSMDFGTATPASADMSPISQTSPISMSPLSGSPLSSGINSPIASCLTIGVGVGVTGRGKEEVDSSVLMKIHSRRYRESVHLHFDLSR